MRSCEEAPEDFDPKENVKYKIYRYKIENSRLRSAIGRQYVWYIKKPLDRYKPEFRGLTVDRKEMKKATSYFVGRHDFASFCHIECTKNNLNTERELTRFALLN